MRHVSLRTGVPAYPGLCILADGKPKVLFEEFSFVFFLLFF